MWACYCGQLFRKVRPCWSSLPGASSLIAQECPRSGSGLSRHIQALSPTDFLNLPFKEGNLEHAMTWMNLEDIKQNKLDKERFCMIALMGGNCCCCCWVSPVVADSVRPHRWEPTRLRRPWDSPSKNTRVGCHFLLQCRKVKSESEVAQSCPTQQPHGLQPTRLLHSWDFPGKSTGAGCHCLLRQEVTKRSQMCRSSE